MPAIFRRFRERLLKEKRFGKYLIYAIGEIILVVFGILIALQVNIVNENRKQAIRVEGFIVQLKLQIEKNGATLKKVKERDKKRLDVSKRAISNLYEGNESASLEDLNSLILCNVYDHKLNLDMIIIEEAKSNGNFDLIPSDSLRITLHNYVNEYERFKTREVVVNEDLTINFKPYLNDHYNLRYLINAIQEFDLGPSPFRNNNYLQILEDPVFENHIITRVMFAEEMMNNISLLENLQVELTSLLQEY